MDPTKLDRQQEVQDEEYLFPYHYLDLYPGLDYANRIWQSLRGLVREFIGPCTGQRLLDAGCGDARLCYDMKGLNVRLTGVDYSARALAWARAFNPTVELVQDDLRTYRPGEPFDVIVLSEVLEHLRPELAPEVLANLSRCLTDEGKLIITVPSRNAPVSRKHYQHFDADRLRSVLRPHFEVAEIHGHVRVGPASKVFALLTIGPYFLLRVGKMPLFRMNLWLAERILRHIERCPADKGQRLVAVCRKARA